MGTEMGDIILIIRELSRLTLVPGIQIVSVSPSGTVCLCGGHVLLQSPHTGGAGGTSVL